MPTARRDRTLRLVAYIAGHERDEQRGAIRAWARLHRHRVSFWASDDDESAAGRLADRTDLLRALEAVREGRAAALIVANLAVLGDVIAQESLIAEVRRHGDMLSTDPADADVLSETPTNRGRRQVRQVVASVSELERALVSHRQAAGRRRKTAATGWTPGGAPFGYRNQDGRRVPDADEQATLERIRAMRDDGLSLRAMAARLDDEGRVPRRAASWKSETLRRVISRLDQEDTRA